MKPVLLLEMNEIPWRVVDLYRADARFPALRKFFAESRTYTTVAVDSGELSPWVTWPSLHRGMPNDAHHVYNLGQDPATFKGVPVWDEVRARGLSVGVCGSLQSWPPRDPGRGGFYIPDTFAHDERCIPAHVEPFQRFNLAQVKRNGRVVQGGFGRAEVLRFLKSLPRLGLRVSTLWAVARQLLGERRDRALVARRPIFQTVLLWDVFKSLFDARRPPAFSTFFTNHVAGVMHRYWDHVFPEDFGKTERGPHKATMDFAMAYVDKMLADAMRYQEKNHDLRVVFASSMGQAAIRWEDHEGFEASIPGLADLFSVLGVEATAYRPLLAMVPQIAVEIADASARADARAKLEACRTRSGEALFSVQEIGASLSVTIETPRLPDIEAGGFRDPAGGWRTWAEAGIAMNAVEAGTAYHIPEGVLAVRVPGSAGDDARSSIRADAVKDLLLEWAELPVAAAVPA